jgi:hypothetical protein
MCNINHVFNSYNLISAERKIARISSVFRVRLMAMRNN